jgi:hypothetical protein
MVLALQLTFEHVPSTAFRIVMVPPALVSGAGKVSTSEEVVPLTMGDADTRLRAVFELEPGMLKTYPALGPAFPTVVVTEMEEYVPVVASNTNDPKIRAPSESTASWIYQRFAAASEIADAVPPVMGRCEVTELQAGLAQNDSDADDPAIVTVPPDAVNAAEKVSVKANVVVAKTGTVETPIRVLAVERPGAAE